MFLVELSDQFEFIADRIFVLSMKLDCKMNLHLIV